MDQSPIPQRTAHVAQRVLEHTIFGSRWLLAPFYLGLAAALAVLLIKFAEQTVALCAHALTSGSIDVILSVLSLIDLLLVANLVMMMILAGYETFVSRLDVAEHEGRLDWMGRIGFSDLKLKLMASIVAISAIHLLEGFINADHMANRNLAWQLGILMGFVVSGVLLAVMDRLANAPFTDRR